MTADELGVALAGEPALAGARLLVLHGSRARGDAGPDADWDLGFLDGGVPGGLDGSPDLATIVTAVAGVLGTDRVDVVDLAVASALLRFRAARDGVVVLEREHGAFLRFREEAVRYWCDAGPVIRAAQADVLARLG